jgi:hypothetical protein
MAAQGMSGISAAAKARQNDRNATGVANLSHHVQHDIGMTQGQRMAAQLAPVLTSASQQRLPKESEARQAGVYM